MNNAKKYLLYILVILFIFFSADILFTGCRSTRISASDDILSYQRKVTELENTIRDYERRIEVSNEQLKIGVESINGDIESINNIGDRAKTIGDTVGDVIELFTEYQQGVEQLLRHYNTLRAEIENQTKNNACNDDNNSD